MGGVRHDVGWGRVGLGSQSGFCDLECDWNSMWIFAMLDLPSMRFICLRPGFEIPGPKICGKELGVGLGVVGMGLGTGALVGSAFCSLEFKFWDANLRLVRIGNH